MSGYRAEWQSAYADIKAAGQAVTFREPFGSGSVSGVAIEVDGDPHEYENANLVQRDPKTLLFASDTYGDVLSLGWVASWAGRDRTVERVKVTAPDGTPIISTVTVAV